MQYAYLKFMRVTVSLYARQDFPKNHSHLWVKLKSFSPIYDAYLFSSPLFITMSCMFQDLCHRSPPPPPLPYTFFYKHRVVFPPFPPPFLEFRMRACNSWLCFSGALKTNIITFFFTFFLNTTVIFDHRRRYLYLKRSEKNVYVGIFLITGNISAGVKVL